jgi:hypothetical protein
MRILAASFMTEQSAAAALLTLNRRFATSRGFRLAPLGQFGNPNRPSTVLAGPFDEDVVAAVKRAVEELGGTVVIDIDEEATGRRR